MPSSRPYAQFPCNEAGLVGEFLGSAYDTVKRVYDNLEEIQRLDGVLTEIEDVATVVAKEAIDEQMPVFEAKLDEMVDAASTNLNEIADRAETAAQSAETTKDQAISETTEIKDQAITARDQARQAQAEAGEIRDQAYVARDEARSLVENFDNTARVKVYGQMPNPIPMYELFMVLDEIKPVVTSFVVTSNVVSPLPVTSFEATDDNGVTGWWIGETSAIPALNDPNWRSSKPTTYATNTVGATTLYARVRDAAGNVSDATTASVNVLNNPYVDVNWPYSSSRDTGIYPIGGGSAVYSSAPEFTPEQTVNIKAVGLALFKDPSSPTGTATLQLTVRSGAPDGTILATATIPTISNTTPEGKIFTLPSTITLTGGTKYFFTVAATGVSGNPLFRLAAQTGVGTTWSKDNANPWTLYAGRAPLRLEKA